MVGCPSCYTRLCGESSSVMGKGEAKEERKEDLEGHSIGCDVVNLEV